MLDNLLQTSSRIVLGSFCYQLEVSVRPTDQRFKDVVAIQGAYRPLPSGPSSSQQTATEHTRGFEVPLTYQGLGITPKMERKTGKTLTVDWNDCIQLDAVQNTGEDATTFKYKLMLTNWASGAAFEVSDSYYKESEKLPVAACDGLLLRVDSTQMPTIRWEVDQPLQSGTALNFVVKLGGHFGCMHKRSWYHTIQPYKMKHIICPSATKSQQIIL